MGTSYIVSMASKGYFSSVRTNHTILQICLPSLGTTSLRTYHFSRLVFLDLRIFLLCQEGARSCRVCGNLRAGRSLKGGNTDGLLTTILKSPANYPQSLFSAKARPDPDFRYLSNAKAFSSFEKAT